MTPLVRIEDLAVDFATEAGSVTAVSKVDLDVFEGEVLAIVGESGSGKSVTARSIIGLLPDNASVSGSSRLRRKTSGQLEEMTTASPRRLRQIRGSDVSMVFQEPSTALNPSYTVGWQIGEALRAHGVTEKAAIADRVVEVMRDVGIPDPETRMSFYPHQFSGGQRQRLVIAMALIVNPSLILADEPTTALDVTVQADVLALLRRMRDRHRSAILLITHNMGVVADLADRVAVMYRGEIVETGRVEEIFANPQHEYTRSLLEAVPVIGQHPPRALEETPAPPEVVVAQDLVVEYPVRSGTPLRAVDEVSFTIRAGEVLGLVGESGSGKSTIGRAVAGLTPVTTGSLTVNGVKMKALSARRLRATRADVGFVFQDPATSFDPRKRIFDIVAAPMRIQRWTEVREQVLDLLELVQLPRQLASRFPHELSGGQRQRVGIARALALRPALVIADEPTSALDVSVQSRLLDLFLDIQRERRFACLFITHDLAVVDRVAHTVAVMKAGRMLEQGRTRTVLTDPADTYTRTLIASAPVPDPARQREKNGQALLAATRL